MLRIHWLTVRLIVPGPEWLTERTSAFWAEVTASTRTGPGLLQPEQGAPYLALERLDGAPAPGQGPDGRCRLGVEIGPGDSLERATEQAISLGATPAGHDDDAVRLESPGGYEFSLSASRSPEVSVPPPGRLDAGGLNRADQICLDVPPSRFGAECAFWQTLTGWPLTSDPASEFASLRRPADIPIRILVQRRDAAGPDEPVTGHLDFATQDRKNLAERHIRAGATRAGEFPGWISLRDPAGRVYCLTARDPATGLRP